MHQFVHRLIIWNEIPKGRGETNMCNCGNNSGLFSGGNSITWVLLILIVLLGCGCGGNY